MGERDFVTKLRRDAVSGVFILRRSEFSAVEEST
jgi:hypothetical protein